MNTKRGIVAFLSAFIFALGLGISGMTQPEKVIGFLNPVKNWDPSLMFVMVGAILVHAIALRFILKRPHPLFDVKFNIPTLRKLDLRLLGGAAIFGLGWGLGGYCPGPAITSLVSGGVGPIVFVGAMAVGMLLARLLEPKPAAAPEPPTAKGAEGLVSAGR